jgi:hypothetical protein
MAYIKPCCVQQDCLHMGEKYVFHFEFDFIELFGNTRQEGLESIRFSLR